MGRATRINCWAIRAIYLLPRYEQSRAVYRRHFGRQTMTNTPKLLELGLRWLELGTSWVSLLFLVQVVWAKTLWWGCRRDSKWLSSKKHQKRTHKILAPASVISFRNPIRWFEYMRTAQGPYFVHTESTDLLARISTIKCLTWIEKLTNKHLRPSPRVATAPTGPKRSAACAHCILLLLHTWKNSCRSVENWPKWTKMSILEPQTH